MNKKPKAIFIDWFDTLSYTEVLDQLSDKKHPLHDKQKLIRDFLYMNKNTWTKQLLLGNISMRDYCDELARKLGIPSHTLLSEFANSFSKFTWADPLFPNYLKAIKDKGIKTVLIANASQAFRKYTVPALSLNKYFSSILLSCELKCLKYDTSLEDMLFLDWFLKDNKISYEDCLVLDDKPERKILNIFEVPYEVITDEGSLKAVLKKYI